MKPVMEKVAANLFDTYVEPLFYPVQDFYEDKVKPFYNKKVKPYTGTLDAKGYAGSSALGGLLGYLYSKYISDDDSPWSNIVSTLGGALAGAGIHTATQIMRERGRIKSNATLPPDQQVNPDGSKKGKAPLLDAWSTGSTLGGGLVGYKTGVGLVNKSLRNKIEGLNTKDLPKAQEALAAAKEKWNDARSVARDAESVYSKAKDLEAKYITSKQRIPGDVSYNATTAEANHLEALKDVTSTSDAAKKAEKAVEKIKKQVKNLEKDIDKSGVDIARVGKKLTIKPNAAHWYTNPKNPVGKALINASKLRPRIAHPGKAVAGGLGALLFGGGMYTLTNPRMRAAIAKKLDE